MPRPAPSPPQPPPLAPPPIDSCFSHYKWGAFGEMFRGSVSHTVTGRRCQLWRRQYPHEHPFHVQLGEDTPLTSNFCRNPAYGDLPLKAAPWCYTIDPDVEFELCDICSASKKFLEPVSAPHVHHPVPEWVGPLCLTFSLTVLASVLGWIGWKASGRDCGSACEEIAFGRRVRRGDQTQTCGTRPRQTSPPACSTGQRGNVTTGEGTFSTLAGLARFQQHGGKPSTAPKGSVGLALLEHDMVALPRENANVV